MHASVHAFLDQIIDYAGLFPPAKLPLEEALPRYLHYRKESPHRWMLGRFVCPTTKLPELLALAQGHPDRDLLSIAALGQACSQVSEVYTQVDEDRRAIEDFRRAWGQESVIDIYEVALPKEKPAAAVRNVSNLIAKCWHAAFGRNAVREVTDVTDRIANCWTFLEPPRTPAWRRDLQGLFSEISDLRENHNFATSVGVKLRCGGLTADAFPSDEEVADFIYEYSEERLSWKATAGLHHPRRHWDATLQVWHHGFLNVFGAGVLAATNPLTYEDIVAILADREAQHFRFEEERMSWKDWSCTTAQIVEARAAFATSFGSCSFDEPCEDLKAMGLVSKPEA